MSSVFTTITETYNRVPSTPKIYREEKNARKDFQDILKKNNIKISHADDTGLYADNDDYDYSVALHIDVKCSD